MVKNLIISPHIDDELLGCGGILDESCHVLYGGNDESDIRDEWVMKRPSSSLRMEELYKVQEYLGFNFTILPNKVNKYKIQNLISSFEKTINEIKPQKIYVPGVSYNQDHKVVYDAAMIALRPHDLNYFIKKVLLYEQPQIYLWNNTSYPFKPNYFIPIDIDKKINAYKLMSSQVRKYRSPETLVSMAKIRGKQSRHKYAEAFEILRWIE